MVYTHVLYHITRLSTVKKKKKNTYTHFSRLLGHILLSIFPLKTRKGKGERKEWIEEAFTGRITMCICRKQWLVPILLMQYKLTKMVLGPMEPSALAFSPSAIKHMMDHSFISLLPHGISQGIMGGNSILHIILFYFCLRTLYYLWFYL